MTWRVGRHYPIHAQRAVDAVNGTGPAICGRPGDHLRHTIPMSFTCPGSGPQVCRPESYEHLGPWDRVPGSDSLDRCQACGTVIGK